VKRATVVATASLMLVALLTIAKPALAHDGDCSGIIDLSTISPPDGATFALNEEFRHIGVNAVDASNVLKIEVFVDGTLLGYREYDPFFLDEDPSNSQLPTSVPGTHTIEWRVIDGSSNTCVHSGHTYNVAGETVGPASGFVTRDGTRVLLDDRPFPFTGINIYNANSDGWCGPEMRSGSRLDDALSSVGPGKEVLRAWFFQPLAIDWGTGQRDWTAFDHTLAVADAHGMKVIPTLTDEFGECGTHVLNAPENGIKLKQWYVDGYTQTQPGNLDSYRDWVAEVVDRYKDDPRIAFWQLTNEAEIRYVDQNGVPLPCPPGNEPADILRSWASDVSGLVKSIDANHLVSLGTIGSGQCGAQAAQYQDVHDVSTIDLCEYHDYGSPSVPIPGDQWNGLQVRIDQCTALNKPIFVGEAGIIPNDVGGTFQTRADAFQAKLDAQFPAGVRGFLAWAWSPNSGPSTLNNYDIGAGDPALDSLVAPRAPLAIRARTDRVSVAADGGDASGPSPAFSFDISDDGRYVAFDSAASNLVAGDTNDSEDVFVRDLETGTTRGLSVTSERNRSAYPAISGDGRFVAFVTNASLTEGPGYYVYDLQNDELTRIAGASGLWRPSISADGRYVGYVNSASRIVEYDRQTATGTVVSVASDGTLANDQSSWPSLSADGRYVAFTSLASNLVPGDTNGDFDVFVHDLVTGDTWRASESSTGGQGNGRSFVTVDGGGSSISADGRYVTFYSRANNLVDGDTNGVDDVFLHDNRTETTIRVSVSTTGQEGNGFSARPSISADGNFVAFDSAASNLVPGDDNGLNDQFVHDVVNGRTFSVSVTPDGAQGNGFSAFGAAIDGDGSVVVFPSHATDLVPGDTNGLSDLFVRSVSSAAPPDPPTQVTAAAGDASATVSWSAPASDGGSPITSHTVTSSPGGLTSSVSGSTTQTTIAGLTNGTSYTFTVTAANDIGTSDPSSPSNAVTPQVDAPPPTTATGTADAGTGGEASTGSDPTPSQPLTTTVEVPPGTEGGPITIAQTTVDKSAPAGYSFLGQQIEITAPDATQDQPLRLTFTLDPTIASGQTPTSIQIFRTENGVTEGPIPNCTALGAFPDPCVSSRGYVNGTDIQVTILASSASAWNFGVVPYQFSGFFSPVTNPPTLNSFKAGSTVPVKFSLHGNKGLAIFATGYPKVQPISCATRASTGSLTSASGTLAYDRKRDIYTFSWKTTKSWAGTCRQLIVRLNDGTSHPADFRITK
jgi:Fibronectin type III domain/Cellulase (glycosyl hydrolase family 5)/WD40-like Beta Propeller Repeat